MHKYAPYIIIPGVGWTWQRFCFILKEYHRRCFWRFDGIRNVGRMGTGLDCNLLHWLPLTHIVRANCLHILSDLLLSFNFIYPLASARSRWKRPLAESTFNSSAPQAIVKSLNSKHEEGLIVLDPLQDTERI